MGELDEVPAVKLTGPVRAVLAVLARRPGHKLGVRDLAKATGRSPGSVRGALTALGKGRLVRHMIQQQETDRPPYAVWWITQAGRDVAAAVLSEPPEREPERVAR